MQPSQLLNGQQLLNTMYHQQWRHKTTLLIQTLLLLHKDLVSFSANWEAQFKQQVLSGGKGLRHIYYLQMCCEKAFEKVFQLLLGPYLKRLLFRCGLRNNQNDLYFQ